MSQDPNSVDMAPRLARRLPRVLSIWPPLGATLAVTAGGIAFGSSMASPLTWVAHGFAVGTIVSVVDSLRRLQKFQRESKSSGELKQWYAETGVSSTSYERCEAFEALLTRWRSDSDMHWLVVVITATAAPALAFVMGLRRQFDATDMIAGYWGHFASMSIASVEFFMIGLLGCVTHGRWTDAVNAWSLGLLNKDRNAAGISPASSPPQLQESRDGQATSELQPSTETPGATNGTAATKSSPSGSAASRNASETNASAEVSYLSQLNDLDS